MKFTIHPRNISSSRAATMGTMSADTFHKLSKHFKGGFFTMFSKLDKVYIRDVDIDDKAPKCFRYKCFSIPTNGHLSDILIPADYNLIEVEDSVFMLEKVV